MKEYQPPLYLSHEAERYVKKRLQEVAQYAATFDMVIFLDKAARALHMALRQAMKRYAEPMPRIRFLNYGTEKSLAYISDFIDSGEFDIHWGQLTSQLLLENITLSRMRSSLSDQEIQYLEDLLLLRSPLNRLVVDEISISGGTFATLDVLLKSLSYYGSIQFESFVESPYNNLFIRPDGNSRLLFQSSDMFGINNRSNRFTIRPSNKDAKKRANEVRRAFVALT